MSHANLSFKECFKNHHYIFAYSIQTLRKKSIFFVVVVQPAITDLHSLSSRHKTEIRFLVGQVLGDGCHSCLQIISYVSSNDRDKKAFVSSFFKDHEPFITVPLLYSYLNIITHHRPRLLMPSPWVAGKNRNPQFTMITIP